MAIEVFFNKMVTAIICVCLKKLAKTVLMDKSGVYSKNAAGLIVLSYIKYRHIFFCLFFFEL
jgi:hypothetical protein